MPRLIWVFAGRTHILLVLSCHAHVYCYQILNNSIRIPTPVCRQSFEISKKHYCKRKSVENISTNHLSVQIEIMFMFTLTLVLYCDVTGARSVMWRYLRVQSKLGQVTHLLSKTVRPDYKIWNQFLPRKYMKWSKASVLIIYSKFLKTHSFLTDCISGTTSCRDNFSYRKPATSFSFEIRCPARRKKNVYDVQLGEKYVYLLT